MPERAQLEPRIQELCKLWGVEPLAPQVRVEFSSRMTHSLGRAYLDRNLVRLGARLAQGPGEFLDEVLCHELAHLAAARIHGRSVRPHGREWRSLMVAAGFAPTARLRVPEGVPQPPRRKRRRRARRIYEHRCPVCQTRRSARRAMRNWRCRRCLDSGGAGLLEIRSYPAWAVFRL